MFFLDHIWLIPLLPALGAAIMLLFGRKLEKSAVSAISVGVVVVAFLSAAGVVIEYSAWAASPEHFHQPFEKIVYSWLGSDTGHLTYVTKDGTAARFQADAGFLIDPLSSIWLLFVTGVGMLIHIYSMGYMAHEGGYYRFFGYLNLFMFSMLTLILGNNYALLFVGWEGVGLCSYLLIGFYFHRKSATDAANKAFIVNRIGDAAFLLGMYTLAWYFRSLRFTEITQLARSGQFQIGDPVLTAAALLLFVGACGKSAQLPLYVWLPDAMEGPTPVSALIHAATMVTAGVYMVARSNPIFDRAPDARLAVAVIGTLTAIFAASIGIVQTDIKKVLAYSTVSQLGYMFMGCGVAAYGAGIFHLMTHAFFKGCLFLCSGSIIHGLGGEQDMRYMGGLRKFMPWTFLCMSSATIAIAGIPPFAAFFSKDEILAATFASGHRVLWLVGIIAAGMTSFYMFRLWFLTFFGAYRGPNPATGGHGHDADAQHAGHTGAVHDAQDKHADPGSHGHGAPHESPWVMVVPLIILAILSFIGGWVG
ncbi:MAG: NADH-quinone oxidoreductase subunit L, partial [Acidobacteria bacterium]|nr:NADH-quinone oxidoreductase subunit L [Acidobacteriota bacterium]